MTDARRQGKAAYPLQARPAHKSMKKLPIRSIDLFVETNNRTGPPINELAITMHAYCLSETAPRQHETDVFGALETRATFLEFVPAEIRRARSFPARGEPTRSPGARQRSESGSRFRINKHSFYQLTGPERGFRSAANSSRPPDLMCPFGDAQGPTQGGRQMSRF